MGATLDRLTIRGFKSIERLEDFELGSLNVLIGANGAGKSNFVEFFRRLLRAMVDQRLQEYMLRHGPADGYFFNGVKHTRRIEAELCFTRGRYTFTLEPTAEGTIFVGRERAEELGSGRRDSRSGKSESALATMKDDEFDDLPSAARHTWETMRGWNVYHFHDTSMTAGMRRDGGIEQTNRLDPGAENLAAFLLGLRNEHLETYQMIRRTVQRMAPYFDDFELSVRQGKVEDQVRLTWKQQGTDYIFSPGHLSDGTIRFVCLATALLQPSPPTTVVVDEPELGLHPEALSILAGLLRSASKRTQIVVATQSPILLSEFDPEEVITVELANGASRFSRLDQQALTSWLSDFSLGELWQKGTIGGGVVDE